MKKLRPLKISYVPKSRIWGGYNLGTLFGKENGGENMGETWELTVRNDENSVILTGEHKGKILGEYIESDKSVLGSKYDGGRFPLLIKYLDAEDTLSVQVHPDDDYATKNENDPGKTEMWYIVDAKPGAKLIYGLAEGLSREDFAEKVRSGNISSAMGYVEVKKGEVYFIPSGMLHAIGAGILIAEIQQNSDLTYRVYDFDRRDAQGNTRELHVEKSLDVIRPFTEAEINAIRYGALDEKDDENTIAHCKYFRVKYYNITSEKELYADDESFVSLICIGGCGNITVGEEKYPIKGGDSYFIPASLGAYTVTGEAEIIVSSL